MADLVAFLTARLDEIEHALGHLPKRANESTWQIKQQGVSAQGGSRGHSVPWAIETRRDEHGWFVAERMNRSIAEYIARVADPSRVLAEVAAKRAILAIHSTPHTVVDAFCVEEGGDCTHAGESRCAPCGYDDGCPTVHHLAAPYATHPDFDPAWRLTDG